MPTEKVYSIRIEMGAAQQQLETATKTLGELKTRAQAANAEAQEAKQIYDQNAAALRELAAAEKQLTTAQQAAAPGQGWAEATAALTQNQQAQQRLNKTVEESRVDYEAAKKAAGAAGQAVTQQAATVKELAESVKQYQAAAAAAAKEFAPGTFGAINQEVQQLREELQHMTDGSDEAAAAIRRIAEQESKLRGLDQKLQASNPEAQAKAFGLLTGAIAGTVGVATTCAQVFGLSEKTAQEYTQRMQQLTGVLASVDAVSRLLNGENLGLIKSIVASGKAWLTAAEGAATGAKITRAALISTGIGALVALVGTLIGLWVEFGSAVSSSESTFTKFKAAVVGGFDAMLSLAKDYSTILFQLATFDFSGVADTFAQGGKKAAQAYRAGAAEVVADAHRAELQKQIEQHERLLKINQAAGVNTAALERQILREKIAVTKQGTEEEKKAHQDAVAELAAFNKAQGKKQQEEAEAQTLARLNGVLALEQAHGRDVYQAQLNAEQEKLRALQQAAQPEQAAITAQQNVIAALQIAHAKDVNEKLTATRLAALEGRIALEQQKGNDAFNDQLKREKIYLDQLLAAGTQNGAAIQKQRDAIALLIEQHEQEVEQKRRAALILANQNEITLREKQGKDTLDLRLQNAELLLSLDKDGSTKEIAQREADYQKLLELQEDYNAQVRAGLQANQAQRDEQAQQGRELDAKFIEGTADYLQEVVNKSLQKQKFDLGTSILTKFFGVKTEDVEKVKAALNQAFAEIAQSVGGAVDAALAAGLQEAQAQLDAAQAQLQELGSKLSEASSKRQSDETALQSATGARRTYLIGQVEKERKAEADLAAQKAKSAREAAAAQREHARLEKEQQQIAAASTAIEATLLAIKAAQTVVEIASAGKFGIDNIALAIAGAATIAASIFTVKNAARQFESGTGALGSDGVLRGPRHSGGGIQLYSPNGVHWGEAEGGEAVTPVNATQRNGPALELIRTAGRTRTLGPADYVLALAGQAQGVARGIQPPPASYLQAGGALNRGAAPSGGAATADEARGTRAEQQRTNALLTQALDQLASTAENTAATAGHTKAAAASNQKLVDYGPPRARTLEDVQREAEHLRQHNTFVQGLTL